MSKSKSYGPMGFEATWKKKLKGFNETKLFFSHGKPQTVIKYIDGDKLLGVEMYRSGYEIERWLNHFQHYVDTGTFDTNAYWVTYKSEYSDKNDQTSKLITTCSTEVHAIPMVLKNQVWSEHSPEMNKFMNAERKIDKALGFKMVPRPIKEKEECKN